MQVKHCEQRSDEWHNARMGKITGTGLEKLSGTKAKRDNYFYELLAERLSVESQQVQSPLERGIELEDEAIEQFEAKTGKITTQVGLCIRDDNSFIANSPDRLIENDGEYTEAVEVKCPSSAKHLQYLIEDKIPEQYYYQVLQYFIVNDKLQKLYFVSYDNRIPSRQLWIKEITRDELLEQIEYYKEKQEEFIKDVSAKVEEFIKDNF